MQIRWSPEAAEDFESAVQRVLETNSAAAQRVAQIILDIDREDFAGAVPAQRKSVPDATADQKNAPVFVESESVPAISERARIQFAPAFVEHELAAVQMPAECEMEPGARRRRTRIVRAENMAFTGQEFLIRSSINYRRLRPSQRTVLQPVPAAGANRLPHTGEASPPIVIPSDCGNRGGPRHVRYEMLQWLKATAPVHQVPAKQDDIGAFLRHNLTEAIHQVTRPVFLQMKVACEENAFAEAEVRKSLAADEKRPA